MSLKKITSLTMLLAMLVMTFTGILLFIAPQGRVANWANWEILGLSKELIAGIHTTFMVLFIVATILHIFYNFNPMISYMKNSAREFVLFTKEMIVAFILTIVFLAGTVFEIAPFSTFLGFGEKIKNSWEKDYGTAPYSHAELSSLESFTSKVGFDLEKSKEILKASNIKFEQTQSLAKIAENNSISPNFIYNLLKMNLQKNDEKSVPLTGLGKKTVNEVAQTLGISSEEFISKLNSIGINANKNDKFKEVVEQQNSSVSAVLIKLGYKKEE